MMNEMNLFRISIEKEIKSSILFYGDQKHLSSKSKGKLSKLALLPFLEASIPSITEFKEFLNSFKAIYCE